MQHVYLIVAGNGREMPDNIFLRKSILCLVYNPGYVDGNLVFKLEINDQTGSAYCANEKEAVIKTWKVKFSPDNTVFQAEMLALKAAIEWAIPANEVNIWSDSEYSLQALKLLYVKRRKRLSQITLLGNARIRLGWVKAHLGIKGNGTEDTLATESTTDGTPANLPFPKSYLKNQLL
ncbi:hypothetical protein AVEN_117331-1 [Araneus ventricosus]|uniref:RNase H type-1 domain-containing protein n=1 Tax=Araneus ventricosus TaxID=182803 RepID=A0A4Y2JIC8_ARAVE|nr:hypothetical protein AVEN_117331-1 [Araneus ventricosus]